MNTRVEDINFLGLIVCKRFILPYPWRGGVATYIKIGKWLSFINHEIQHQSNLHSSVEDIRYMIGYIVDLTVILRSIYVSGHDVSTGKVHEAMNHHVVSGLQRRIHKDIRRFVTEGNSFAHGRNGPIIGKITELIRQSFAPHSGSN